MMAYPPVPWAGIMLTGFAAGTLFELPITRRKAFFTTIGFSSLLLFVIVRVVNVYGDSFAWAKQKSVLFTVLSFINVTKYPPSLLFCLLMLGLMFLILALVSGVRNKITNITSVFGKVPLFYFVVHWYILHPLLLFIVLFQGYSTSEMLFGFNFGRPKGISGVSLLFVFIIWILVVVAPYPLCRWYGKYKEANREKQWLRYL
jgi:uncharacterized membrane protein